MKRFILEKKYDGGWYYDGNYSECTIESLIARVFWLGRYGGCYEDVRVTVKEEEEC